jgi:ribosomal protein L24E
VSLAATGICVDGTGKVFVNSDARTQVFDRAGKHVVTFTSASLEATLAWNDLYGIAVDHEGRLLVCSQSTNSLLRMM